MDIRFSHHMSHVMSITCRVTPLVNFPDFAQASIWLHLDVGRLHHTV